MTSPTSLVVSLWKVVVLRLLLFGVCLVRIKFTPRGDVEVKDSLKLYHHRRRWASVVSVHPTASASMSEPKISGLHVAKVLPKVQVLIPKTASLSSWSSPRQCRIISKTSFAGSRCQSLMQYCSRDPRGTTPLGWFWRASTAGELR